MFPYLRFIGITSLALACLAVSLQAEKTAATAQAAWESTASFRFNEAYAEFEQLLSKNPSDSREIKLGAATALIGVQPETATNVEKAARLCGELVQENPDDSTGQLAAYLLARIEQYHRQPANPDKAEEIYLRLLQQHPQSIAARLTLPKLAVLQLFAGEKTSEARQKNLAKLEAILPQMPVEAHCETYLVMGNACLYFQLGDARALRYLTEAEVCGVPSVKLRGDVLVQIGTLAQKLGRRDLALESYGKFISGYKRDTRNYLIQQKIAELQLKP